MMSQGIFKVRSKLMPTNEPQSRYATQYPSSNTKCRTSASIKNRLTKGLKKYQDIKQAYTKPCDSVHFKTDHCDFSFEPHLSTDKRTKQKSRSIKKFIEDQQNYQLSKEDKIKQFKTEMTRTQAEECLNRPEIDKYSRKLCTMNSYSKQNVVERLSKKKIIAEVRDDEDLFSPKILPRSKSLKRSKTITKLMQEDAQRRQEKMEIIQSQKIMKDIQSPKINQNTNRLVSKKLYHQFCQLVPENQDTIPVVMAWTVIGQLFNIDIDPSQQTNDVNLCVDMLNYLCSEGQEIVERNKLWQFIEIIILKDCCSTSSFSQKINDILSQFGHLYTRRVARSRTQISPRQYSFAPETLRSSQNYATNFREKMLSAVKSYIQNQNTTVNIHDQVKLEDVFLIDYQVKKASLQKKKLQKQQAQMKQCTFKPKINDSSYRKMLPPKMKASTATMKMSSVSSAKTLEPFTLKSNQSLAQSFVYNPNATLASSKSRVRQTSKKQTVYAQKTDKMYFSTQKTKQNASNNNRSVNSQKKIKVQVKNLQKSIMRTALGRRNREFETSMKSRGYPQQENWTQFSQNQKKAVAKQHKKLSGYKNATNYKKITLR